jgi:ABC-2 type transport system permease protein
MFIKRIVNITYKELIQLTRAWMLVLVIIGPTLELALLVRTVSHGISHLPVAIVDQDHSQTSRELIAAVSNHKDLDVTLFLDSPDQISSRFESGQAILAVVIPMGLESDLNSGRASPQVQLIADGSNSMTSSAALSAAAEAINDWLARRADTASRGSWPTVDLQTLVHYNPTLSGRPFTLSAQLGFMVYQVALIVAALGLTRERELGTLEQLLVTPLRRLELIAGKAIPAILIGMVDFFLMWAVITWGFGLPTRGSFLLLTGLSLLFVIAQVGWGLIVSALSGTQQQAVLMVFVLALIDVSFSGYVQPVDHLPAALRIVSQLFPLQHYLIIIRAVMLKGAGLADVWQAALALVALSVGSLAVAVVSLRSQME